MIAVCQVQTVVNAHTNEGYNTDGFDGTELVAHYSEKEAEKRADFQENSKQDEESNQDILAEDHDTSNCDANGQD